MRSKALVGFQVMGCALALVACGGGGDDDTGGGGTSGNATTNPGSGGMGGSNTMNPGSGGMGGSNTTNPGTGGKGGGGMNPGTGGKGGGTGGTGAGMGGMGGGMGGMGGDGGMGSGIGLGAMSDCSKAGAALADGKCKATAEGMYAVKTELDVWWKDDNVDKNGFPIVDSGRGTITIYLMGDLTTCDDGVGQGVLKACGSTLPAFSSDLTCDAYQLEFQDAIWDAKGMPTFTTTGMTDSFDPGATLAIAQATGLVGIELDDPTAWPTAMDTGTFKCHKGMGTGLADCFPDQDGDTQPGITVNLKLGGSYEPTGCGTGANQPDCKCSGIGNPDFTYRGSPTSVAAGTLAGGGTGGGLRTKEVHVGLSTTIGGKGTINDDCMSGSGEGMAPVDAIKSRVASCTIDPASKDSGDTDPDHMAGNCAPSDAQFVDENVPNYRVLQKGEKPDSSVNYPNGKALDPTPSEGPKSSVVRLGNRDASVSCAMVRDAFK